VTSAEDSIEEAVTTPQTDAAEAVEVAEVVEVVETPAVEETAAEVVDEAAPAEDAVAETAAAEDAPAEDAPAEDEAPVRQTRPVIPGKPTQTVGRRKQAIVRVRLMPGSGKFTLNGKSLEDYFPNKVHQQLIREPLTTVDKPESFDIFANLRGGGITGQAGALRLAIARALIEVEPDDRPPLKKAGFLTRDPRVKERKKYGLKKARKAPQYSKR
jgi:small subunit ribosomal protein S9